MSHLRVVNPITLEDLKKFPRIYLASPYTLYPSGPEQAFKEVTRLAANLFTAGLNAYSPISYGHTFCEYGVDPFDEDRWNSFNDAQLESADCILVARMIGWQSSKGVTREIKFAEDRKRPLYFIHPETLEVY